MARQRPKLDWETLTHLPHAVLLRLAPDMKNDSPVSVFGTQGGSQRQALTARPGPFSRKSGTVCRTFVFPMGSQHGNAQHSEVRTSRETFTTHELRQMLEGERKTPAGLTEKMITDSIEVMEERETAIRRNNQRAARSYMLKLVASN